MANFMNPGQTARLVTLLHPIHPKIEENDSMPAKSLHERLRIHKIFTKDKTIVVVFSKLPLVLHKVICCGCVLELPR